MEMSLSHTLRLFNIFREYDEKENCAQVLEEELHRMLGMKYVNDEHDCNIVSMNSLNIHDVNGVQSHKLGDAMFDEDAMFSPPSFDEEIYYDESMPPIYDDYCDDMYAIKNKHNHEIFIMILIFNWIMLHMIVILLSLLPLLLMRILIMMKACLLFMMIILMKVGLEECQL